MRFRRKIRKWKLLSILAEHGMCPITKEELNVWETAGKYPIENQAFIGWLKSTDASNPYLDRAKAARETVDPMTLGRALYHIYVVDSRVPEKAPSITRTTRKVRKSLA